MARAQVKAPTAPLAERLANTMAALEAKGSEQTVKTWRRHGCTAPMFGVKVADLKVILKGLKGDHELALALYDTGNSDAQYLAGLLADAPRMSQETLQKWVEGASWYMLAEYTVPWNAAHSGHGETLGRRWIEDPRELVRTAGWHTLCGVMATTPDGELDLPAIAALLDTVPGRLAKAANRERVGLVHFVIGVGWSVLPLRPQALAMAARIGVVKVDVGDTDCKIPVASEYLQKLVEGGRSGKRKDLKC